MVVYSQDEDFRIIALIFFSSRHKDSPRASDYLISKNNQ